MGKTVTRRSKHTFYDNPGKEHRFTTDQQEYRSCLRKTGVYPSEKEALNIAATFQRRLDAEVETVWRAYKCKWCKKWHLTDKAKK